MHSFCENGLRKGGKALKKCVSLGQTTNESKGGWGDGRTTTKVSSIFFTNPDFGLIHQNLINH